MGITYFVDGRDAIGGYMGKTFDSIEDAREWAKYCNTAVIRKRVGVIITEEIVK